MSIFGAVNRIFGTIMAIVLAALGTIADAVAALLAELMAVLHAIDGVLNGILATLPAALDPVVDAHHTIGLAVNQIKTITPFLLNCANCLDLLQPLCSSIRLQTNVTNFTIEEASEWIWVLTKQREPAFASDQLELFQLAGIISTLQSVLRANWRPEIIDLRFVRPSIELARSPDLSFCRHRFARPRAGIAIKPADRSRPLPAGGCFADSTVSTSEFSDLPSSPIEQVSTAMVAMLGNRAPTAACIKDLTELSLRSLQRQFTQEGTSFRKLLDRGRLQKALGLLTCSDLPVQKISAMLGYANPSALSRRFKRWCGMAPWEYRRVWSR